MAGHSRLKDGVASARRCPAIHVFLAEKLSKTWMPGTGPGMTSWVGVCAGKKFLAGCDHPPWDSTTLRQGSESFALFSRKQAFICGGLPTCSAQNFPASERQAICSCGVGPDCADAGRKALAVRITKESVADVRWFEIFMDRL